MTTAQQQLEKEARYDVRVAVIGVVSFFACMLLLPRSFFWFYFVPMAAFWFRYLWIRNRRDEALLRAEIAASGGAGAAGAYRCEGGICITDGTHHLLVARDQRDALLQLTHVRGRE